MHWWRRADSSAKFLFNRTGRCTDPILPMIGGDHTGLNGLG
jgi:hypothetical protein